MWYGIAAGVLLAAITLLVLWNLRRRPYLAVGWFWYLGTLVPVIGLIQVGAQGMADRYTYLPMIGIYDHGGLGRGGIGGAIAVACESRLGVAAGIVLAAWTVLAVVQVCHLEEQRHRVPTCGRRDQRQLLRLQPSWPGISIRQTAPRTDKPMRRPSRNSTRRFDYGPSYDAANANLGVSYMNAQAVRQSPRLLCRARFGQSVRGLPSLPILRTALFATGQDSTRPRPRFARPSRSSRTIAALSPILGRRPLPQGRRPQRRLPSWTRCCDLYPDGLSARMNDIAWFWRPARMRRSETARKPLELAEQADELTKGRDPLILQRAWRPPMPRRAQFEQAVETASEASEARRAVQEQPRTCWNVTQATRFAVYAASGSALRDASPQRRRRADARLRRIAAGEVSSRRHLGLQSSRYALSALSSWRISSTGSRLPRPA